MNITEKRYAMERAFNIIKDKCKEIITEETDLVSAVTDLTTVSAYDIAAMIKNKEIKLKPISKISNNCSANLTDNDLVHVPISEIYDFTALKIKANKTIKQNGFDKLFYQTYNYPYEHELILPGTKFSCKFIMKSQKTYNRIIKAQVLLTSTADKIMLANRQKARFALDKLNNIKL